MWSRWEVGCSHFIAVRQGRLSTTTTPVGIAVRGSAVKQMERVVQQVTQYKLLGGTINAALKWDVITSKAAKQLWFLKKLKRAGVAKEDLAYFFQANDLSAVMRSL